MTNILFLFLKYRGFIIEGIYRQLKVVDISEFACKLRERYYSEALQDENEITLVINTCNYSRSTFTKTRSTFGQTRSTFCFWGKYIWSLNII